MRLFKRLTLIFGILLMGYVAHVLFSTGFFRTIDPYFDGTILAKVPLKGAEDIVISEQDSFALISATNRQRVPAVTTEEGNLFLINLKSNDYKPISLTTSFGTRF